MGPSEEQGFRQLEAKDRQLTAAGDTAIAVCRLLTRSRANGTVIEAPVAQVVSVREGCIVELRRSTGTFPITEARLSRAKIRSHLTHEVFEHAVRLRQMLAII